MANRLIKVGNSFNTPQKYYICEKLSEMGTTGNFGDIVLCAEDGLTYMKDSNGVWQEVSLGGGGGGGNANTEIVAPTYDETKSYSEDELVVYSGVLYRAITDTTAGEFDENDWVETDVSSAKADLISGKVPASQLPSYVDDVIEYSTRDQFPVEGESGKIYVAIDTGYTYRWTGSTYVSIGTATDISALEQAVAQLQTGFNSLTTIQEDEGGLYIEVEDGGE